MEKVCPSCEETFLIAPGLARRYATCSRECGRLRRRALHVGSLNPQWKGDNAGYIPKHVWLANNYPKKSACEECGKRGKTDYAFLKYPEPATRERADYRELCRSCHIALDLRTGERRRSSNGRWEG